MEFVETHGHLDDDAFASDLPQVLDAARAAGVRQFINIGYEPESWNRSLALADRHSDVSYALGMHPNSADRWTNDTAAELERLLSAGPPVGIGETGLDYFRECADRSHNGRRFATSSTSPVNLPTGRTSYARRRGRRDHDHPR